jgi:hypothetical protein
MSGSLIEDVCIRTHARNASTHRHTDTQTHQHKDIAENAWVHHVEIRVNSVGNCADQEVAIKLGAR